MPTAEANGERIFYIDRGKGLPVVMVHGAGGNWRHWALQVRDLAKAGLRAIALDLPGHGKSGGQSYRSIGRYARSVARFVENRKLDGVILAGHSMGGAIVQWLALHPPPWLSGIALVGTGARLRVQPALLQALERGEGTEEIGQLIVGLSRAKQEGDQQLRRAGQEMATVPADRLLDDFLACDRFDLLGRVGEIELPALIVGGGQDRMTPPRYTRYLEKELPETRLLLLEEAGHMVMLEQPKAVSKALIDFAAAVRNGLVGQTKKSKVSS